MKVLIYLLKAVTFLLSGAFYAGAGWVVAWILDAGLNVDVNYSIFVWAGIGLFLISVLPVAIIGTLAKRAIDETEKDLR